MTAPQQPLHHLSDEQVADLLRAGVDELAQRGTPTSFKLLIEASAHLGASLGDAARQLAAAGSWSQVAGISGTSKQAAWSRWR